MHSSDYKDIGRKTLLGKGEIHSLQAAEKQCRDKNILGQMEEGAGWDCLVFTFSDPRLISRLNRLAALQGQRGEKTELMRYQGEESS